MTFQQATTYIGVSTILHYVSLVGLLLMSCYYC